MGVIPFVLVGTISLLNGAISWIECIVIVDLFPVRCNSDTCILLPLVMKKISKQFTKEGIRAWRPNTKESHKQKGPIDFHECTKDNQSKKSQLS